MTRYSGLCSVISKIFAEKQRCLSNNANHLSTHVHKVTSQNYPNASQPSEASQNEDTNLMIYPSKQIKPFDSIPGPRSLPIIGTLWAYLPYIGHYAHSDIYGSVEKKFREYGPIVREELFPGFNIIYLFKAEDIEELMRATSDRPERISHSVVMKYRKSKPEVYNSGGLLPSNGEEWWRIRSKFQKPLSSPQKASVYINVTDLAVSSLIRKMKDDLFWTANENKEDFLKYLSRLYLELISQIAFDVQLDSFSHEEMKFNSLSSKLITATINVSKNVVKLDSAPSFVQTFFMRNSLREVMEGQNKIEEVTMKFLKRKLEKMTKTTEADNSKEKSLLETYLSDPDYNIKDVTGVCADLLLAGVDTTSFTTSFAIYHLAKNKNVQEKLYKESVALLPNLSDKVTAEILNKAFYVKAVVKESLRLNPISVGIGRIVREDIVISGYHIPKGTYIVTANQVCCKLPEYFENPLEFIPERWLRTSSYPKPTSPFASIPFGHGPRMCIARRLAEQDVYIVLLKLVRQFEIGWTGEDLGIISETINKPAGPVSATFGNRN